MMISFIRAISHAAFKRAASSLCSLLSSFPALNRPSAGQCACRSFPTFPHHFSSDRENLLTLNLVNDK